MRRLSLFLLPFLAACATASEAPRAVTPPPAAVPALPAAAPVPRAPPACVWALETTVRSCAQRLARRSLSLPIFLWSRSISGGTGTRLRLWATAAWRVG